MEMPKTYTHEDVKGLAEWFKQHEADIPQSMVMNKSIKYPNLRKTIPFLLEVSEEHWRHPSFAGYILRLEEIRDKILETLPK